MAKSDEKNSMVRLGIIASAAIVVIVIIVHYLLK